MSFQVSLGDTQSGRMAPQNRYPQSEFFYGNFQGAADITLDIRKSR